MGRVAGVLDWFKFKKLFQHNRCTTKRNLPIEHRLRRGTLKANVVLVPPLFYPAAAEGGRFSIDTGDDPSAADDGGGGGGGGGGRRGRKVGVFLIPLASLSVPIAEN